MIKWQKRGLLSSVGHSSLILKMIIQVVGSTNREFVHEEFANDDNEQPGGCLRNGECVLCSQEVC